MCMGIGKMERWKERKMERRGDGDRSVITDGQMAREGWFGDHDSLLESTYDDIIFESTRSWRQ
jgi:hypothetical protein